MANEKHFVAKCFSAVLQFVGASAVICSLYYANADRNTTAGVFIATGIVLFILAHIDRLSELEVFGLKTKLEKAIDAAHVAKNEYREMVELLADLVTRTIDLTPHWSDNLTLRSLLDLMERLRTGLRGAGAEPARIVEVLGPLQQRVTAKASNMVFDIALRQGMQELNQRTQQQVLFIKAGDTELDAKWKAFLGRMSQAKASADAGRSDFVALVNAWFDAALILDPVLEGKVAEIKRTELASLDKYLMTGQAKDLEMLANYAPPVV